VASVGIGAAVALSVEAGAAPVPGGILIAPGSCIAYGSNFTVAGSGFPPASTVALEVPLERYAPFLRPGFAFSGAANTVVTTSPSGSFTASIRAPVHGAAYQPRIVEAIDQGAHLAANSGASAYILVGTPKVCRLLGRLPGQ
jgi:hypothetical protein